MNLSIFKKFDNEKYNIRKIKSNKMIKTSSQKKKQYRQHIIILHK